MQVNPLTHSFVPIAFMVGMSLLTGIGMVLMSAFLGGGRTSAAASTMYECGLDPVEPQRKRIPVRFYVVAMLFILFDVEVALLYPWAIAFGAPDASPAHRLLLFVELAVFVGILVVGYVYLYAAGAFDWVEAIRGQTSRRPAGEAAGPRRAA